jgi:hypothetical protein
MALEKVPDQNPAVTRDGNYVWGALPDDLEFCMDKVLRYSLRRGLLIVLILQPFFKVLLLLYTYEATDHARIDIPLLPRAFRMLFPAKLSLAFHGNLIELSLHVFWRWMEKIYGRFLSPPASDLSSLGPLGILQEILAGRPVVRLNLRGAPKRQLSFLVALVSLIPIMLTLLGWLLLMIFPVVIFLPRRLGWAMVRSISATFRTALRPVPSLLAILVIMFTTADAWRMFGGEPATRFVAFIIVILALSFIALALAMKTPDSTWRAVIGPPDDREGLLRAWAERTPAKQLVRMGVTPILPAFGTEPPATSKDDDAELPLLAHNIRFVYVFTAILHVFAIAFWLSLMFSVIGFIVVSKQLTEDMLGGPVSTLLQFKMFNQEFVLTWPLLVLSICLGCIAALTYAAGTLQSAEGRSAFIEYATLDLRRGIGALSYYTGMLMALLLGLRDMGTLDELSTSIREVLAMLFNLLERLHNDEAEAQAE